MILNALRNLANNLNSELFNIESHQTTLRQLNVTKESQKTTQSQLTMAMKSHETILNQLMVAKYNMYASIVAVFIAILAIIISLVT